MSNAGTFMIFQHGNAASQLVINPELYFTKQTMHESVSDHVYQ